MLIKVLSAEGGLIQSKVERKNDEARKMTSLGVAKNLLGGG